MKPQFGVLLQWDHPLARDLVGAWLLNEGHGNVLWDLSGAGHTGTLTDMDPPGDWVSGPQGAGLDFDGTNDRVIVGPDTGINLGTANACVIRLKVGALGVNVFLGHKSWDNGGYFLAVSGASLYYGANGYSVGLPHGMTVGDEVWLGVSRQGTSVTFYKNGVQLGTPQTLSVNSSLGISSIGGYRVSPYYAASMRCDYVYCWGRPLNAAEMAWLYREPFCLAARRAMSPDLSFAGAVIHAVSGSADAGSTAIADANVTPFLARPTGRTWQEVALDIEAFWLREALLNGMTDTAVKLGTVLTRGWFWMRRTGCSAVYRSEYCNARGRNSAFKASSPVCVAAVDANQVSLPAYLSHEAGSTYYYALRRFNTCGQQDRTTRGRVCVRIGSDSQIAAPYPNSNLEFRTSTLHTMKGHIACLEWFYCPLDQGATPRTFNIYWDGGTGQVDSANAIAVLPYAGRKFYRYESQPLENGKYLFAVRAESVADVAGPPQTCECRVSAPGIAEGPDILEAEAI